MPKFEDLTGKTFSRLTVLEFSGRVGTKKLVTWKCACICGKYITVIAANLKCGNVRSCGCLQGEHRRTHGMSKTSEFRSWLRMRVRCEKENGIGYKYYGGRGIRVCDEWKTFANFISDMGTKPTPKHQIDRIDNNGNYEASNCRWVLPKENSRNRRDTVFLTFNGVRRCIAEWSEVTGINPGTLYFRFNRGWSVERILASNHQKGK